MSPTALTFSCRAVLSGVLAVACLAFASHADAAIQTQPASLMPGDQYRLVFVTSSGSNQSSTDIAFYNTHVSNVANSVPALASLSVDWKAIGSTSAVNARQNTGTDPTPAGPTGVPIFLVDGTLFATNYDDLWDGSPIGQNLNITETGNPLTQTNHSTPNGWVWTGSDNFGFTYFGQFGGPLGSGPTTAVGNSKPNGGVDTSGGADGWMFDTTAHNSHTASFYAMSGVLTVPGDPNVVPEAASVLTWLGLSLAVVVGGSLRRGRQG